MRLALRDWLVTRREERELVTLAGAIGISAGEALAIREEVEAEMGASGGPRTAPRPEQGKVQYIAYFLRMCEKMNILPLARLTPRALHAYLRLPEMGRRSPRLALDEGLGVGPSSVTRYLQELTSWGLLLRTAHGEYAVPRPAIRRLLLIEPDGYHREVLLLDEAYGDEPRRAFACLPVREALRMEIPHAILVLPPARGPTQEPPQVARMPLENAPEMREFSVPSDATPPAAFLRLPCAAPVEALALLASTGDEDLLAAAKEAAPRLGTSVGELAAAVRRLKVVPAPSGHDLPHVVRHPAWLSDRVRAASVAALRRSTRTRLKRGSAP